MHPRVSRGAQGLPPRKKPRTQRRKRPWIGLGGPGWGSGAGALTRQGPAQTASPASWMGAWTAPGGTWMPWAPYPTTFCELWLSGALSATARLPRPCCMHKEHVHLRCLHTHCGQATAARRDSGNPRRSDAYAVDIEGLMCFSGVETACGPSGGPHVIYTQPRLRLCEHDSGVVAFDVVIIEPRFPAQNQPAEVCSRGSACQSNRTWQRLQMHHDAYLPAIFGFSATSSSSAA